MPEKGATLQTIRVMVERWTGRSQAGAQPFGPPPNVARLAGRVLDARGRGIRGATVRIGPQHPPLATGDRGAFTWPELTPGEYTLVVSRPGQPDQAVPLVLGHGMRMEVTLRPPPPGR